MSSLLSGGAVARPARSIKRHMLSLSTSRPFSDSSSSCPSLPLLHQNLLLSRPPLPSNSRSFSSRSSISTIATANPASRIRSSIPSRLSTTLNQRASYSTEDEEMSEPTGLLAKTGIELLTLGTPNGVKVGILLEELKQAYGTEFTFQTINISKNTQKEPWFIAVNPNGRIPAIVDHNRNDFAVFEGLAILFYLTRHYDPEHKFSFPIDSDDYSVAEQWISWQHGGIGPMQGQAGHFVKFAPEKIAYGAQRYVGETERLYGILDARLKDRDWVVGSGRGKYSIADMSLAGWVNSSIGVGLDLDQFPHVRDWFNRLWARPATQRGFTLTGPSSFGIKAIEQKLAEGDADAVASMEATKKFVADAKAQYNYKYASP